MNDKLSREWITLLEQEQEEKGIKEGLSDYKALLIKENEANAKFKAANERTVKLERATSIAKQLAQESWINVCNTLKTRLDMRHKYFQWSEEEFKWIRRKDKLKMEVLK